MKKKEQVVIELEHGVRQKTRPNGEVIYVADCSFNGQRNQPEFADPLVANAYKRRFEEVKRHGVTPPTKEEFLLYLMGGVPATAGAGLDENLLVVDLLPRIAERLGTGATEANVLIRYLGDRKLTKRRSGDLTLEEVLDLPQWLREEGYEQSFARQVIAFARRCFDVAVASRLATHNHFVNMKAKRSGAIDRRGNVRVHHKAKAFTAETLVAVASVLRPVYLLAYWLIVLAGLRCSEAMGLQLQDWIADTDTLKVTGQRKASILKGRSDTKTPAGVRGIRVCWLLARAINLYIADFHGTRPSDPIEAAAWDKRYLLVGVHGGAMDAAAFRHALLAAYATLGLTPDRIGKFRPVHHLRKTFSTMLQRPKAKLSGAAIAAVLGHEHPARTDDDIAEVTLKHYNVLEFDGMTKLTAAVEKWATKQIAPLLDTDNLLAVTEIHDPVTLEDAADLLSAAGQDVSVDDVQGMVRAGALSVTKVNFTNEKDRQVPLVSRSEVNAIRANLVRTAETTYSQLDVTELLALDRRMVQALAADGTIVEVTENPGGRNNAGGARGALPGGGRRFRKEEVDRIVATEAEDIVRRRTWLGISEAAWELSVSPDRVRDMADRDELTVWRDPRSTHRRRFIDPACIQAALDDLEEMTYAEAATSLEAPMAAIRALVKTGHLRRGGRSGTVRKVDVIAYAARAA